MAANAALVVLIVAATTLISRDAYAAADYSDSNEIDGDASEIGGYREELRVLGRQVKVLLERRREDMRSIEENVRRSVYDSKEIVEMREELKKLRSEVRQLRQGQPLAAPHLDKNDALTLKWLSQALNEVRTEMSELQMALNATAALRERESTRVELRLVRGEVKAVGAELDRARRRVLEAEADRQSLRAELTAAQEGWRGTAVACGKTTNQLKSLQMEWNQNWKILTDKSPALETEIAVHPSRHQKIIKQHIIRLEKTTKSLNKENYYLKEKMLQMEEQMKVLKEMLKSQEVMEQQELANENRIQEMLKEKKGYSIRNDLSSKMANISAQQEINTNTLNNLTKQLSDFDKLHLSMLELLENVETIEAKVDKSIPELRREISKLEVQVSEALATGSLLKEDQRNIMNSLKAVTFTVSTMQDKTNEDHDRLGKVDEMVQNLVKSNAMQTSKLHDHILKEESSSVNLNATKATIHLVQELRSFESEYKSIVNKLPRDCSAVDGPSGVYLISPGDQEPILAKCDSGWTTVQKRYDGSINFNRNWNEYSNGFGSATGEHWLGNKHLHLVTKENCSRLQINMKDIYGQYWQANYDDFRVADYQNGFRLYIGEYKGNASDALNYQNLMEFSTVDNDRDISNTHCASNYEGGWWFSHCQHANLNGRYNLGLTWFDSSRNEWIAVAESEMRVKRRDVC
nr:unnamed protein product [Callosobruchus chinensis]